MADSATAQNFRTLSGYLNSMGLGSLFTVDSQGNPGGWLWTQLLSGVDTPEELRAAAEQTNVWRDRFAVIVEQRNRQAQGQPVQVMEPGEVIEYEKSASQLLRRFGAPAWFYDQQADFNNLILNGVSLPELEQRLAGAYNTVANVSPEIKQTFQQFYGVGESDGAMLAFFLDPNKTQEQLDRAAMAAYAGGISKEYGFDLSKDRAELFALIDRTPAGVAQDLSEVNALGNQLNENFTETDDINPNDAFDAVVLGDARARSRLERRVIERKAVDRGGQGGALMTQQGVTGLGTAS